MKDLNHIFFKTQKSFRDWLRKNHDRNPGIWIIFYKKHTTINGMSYREALEEALCFGWIDSIVKKIDDDQYVRKFTPRKNIKNWSDLNKKIVIGLIQTGKMTEAGLKKIDIYLETGKVDWKIEEPQKVKNKPEFNVPDYILLEFGKNEPALTNFQALTKTNKQYYIGWITSAKRDETILKRLQESIDLLKENKKLGLK